MAPTIGRRSSIRSRTSRIAPSSTRSIADTFKGFKPSFSNTKKHKRAFRHSALVSRIEKSKSQSTKRRRPSKKLVTNLEDLVEALPVLGQEGDKEMVIGDARIKHKSLKSKPGAMRKKENLIARERERFNNNMAQMIQTKAEKVSKTATSYANESTGLRWAAIREFIQQRVEQRPGISIEPKVY